jgi:hypothetical protein
MPNITGTIQEYVLTVTATDSQIYAGATITSGAAASTKIDGFLTADGETGTYHVTIAQTIASPTAMVLQNPATPSSPYISNARFRQDFPAFKDPEKYQDSTLSMYLTLAGNVLPANVWADYWTLGQELFAAHFLLIDELDAERVERGQNTNAGPISSKSLGGASVSFSADAMETNAGHWNTTSFGRRFIRFARMAGAGGWQLGGDAGAIQIQPGGLAAGFFIV